MFVLTLNQDNLALSRAEAESFLGTSGTLVGPHLIIRNTSKDLLGTLAYTKRKGSLGFHLKRIVTIKDLLPLITGPYRFSFEGVSPPTKSQLLRFTKQIPHPVKLTNPKTELLFCEIDKSLLCIIDPQKNEEPYEERRAHLRPALHPSSMHPRLCRAFVNLTGIQRGTLFDPMCGSGGILIEAGLRGLDAKGSDISDAMIKLAQTNCMHYGVDADLDKKDVFTLTASHRYIATDLAYGRNTLTSQDLISRFFIHLETILSKRAVIGIPASLDERALVKPCKSLHITSCYTHYLHRSLSKKILVIEKK